MLAAERPPPEVRERAASVPGPHIRSRGRATPGMCWQLVACAAIRCDKAVCVCVSQATRALLRTLTVAGAGLVQAVQRERENER